MLLAVFWIAGMLTGLHISNTVNAFDNSLMRAAVLSGVSMVGLLAVVLFPLILSAIAVYFSVPLFFFLLSFGKAFGFAFCSFRILTAFGSAGWLVRWLLLFSDTCMSVVLLWFWIRNINGIGASSKKDLAVCAAFALLIGCFDYFVVSPFLRMLF